MSWRRQNRLGVSGDYTSTFARWRLCRRCIFKDPIAASGGSNLPLRLGDNGNGHLEPRNTGRKFGALPCRWIRWKPSRPLLVHTGKIVLVRQDDRSTSYLFQGRSSCFQNGSNIGQALPRLLLNSGALDLTCLGVCWRCTRYEDETCCFDSLAIRRRRLCRFRCEDNMARQNELL